MKGEFAAIVNWSMVRIVHLICMFIICPLSLFFSQFSIQWYVVISVTLVLKQPNTYINLYFQFWSTSALENLRDPLHLSSKQQTAKKYQGPADSGTLDLYTVLNLQIKINYFNLILYPVSVRYCPSFGCGILCILIGDLVSKSSLLFFTLWSARKPHFKNRPVIGNSITCS